MSQCELEKLEPGKGVSKARRTGEKLIAFIDGVTADMQGCIIDLKKIDGLWVIDKIQDQDIEHHQIKRNWHVGGL